MSIKELRRKKSKVTAENQRFVIGVDGGGTKTKSALADLSGNIIRTAESGSSSPRNIGIAKAVDNIAESLEQIIKGEPLEIVATFIGSPAVMEEYQSKKAQIKRELKKRFPKIFKGKVKIGSDQEVAFRSGTSKKEGVVVIAGTGAVALGWRGKRQAHCSGWGWLDDEGSGFDTGYKTFRAIMKDIDGRGSKTILTKLAFEKFNFKKEEEFVNFIYGQGPTYTVPLLSVLCDKASRQGDKTARDIMASSASALAFSAETVIERLDFLSGSFPLVMVGGMFKSGLLVKIFKDKIKRIAPKVKFIRPNQDPVVGAVELALQMIV